MKKFNWKEFWISCGIGAGIGLITSLIEFFIEKRKKAKEMQRLVEIKHDREFQEIEKRIEEDNARRRERKEQRAQLNKELDHVNKQLETETDIEKIFELQEKQRQLLGEISNSLLQEV